MYARFIRWASDRLGKNGIIAFITNSSFLDARTFDGFRKVLANEFSDIYVIDLGGDVRKNPKISGTTHNVFGIQTGVAVSFLVKKEGVINAPNKIFYVRRPELDRKETKLSFLAENKLSQIAFERINPDKNHNWLNLTNNDYDELLPLVDKEVKRGKSEQAVFKLFSRGIATQRDEWVYDFSQTNLEEKMQFFVKVYQKTFEDKNYADKMKIKWDRELTKYLAKKIVKNFDNSNIMVSLYRPYGKRFLYFDKHFIGMTYQWFRIYQHNDKNSYISLSGVGSSKAFHCLISDLLVGLDTIEKTQCLPLYYYENGQRIDNITDWGIQQFQNHYRDKTIAKIDIFYYTYAVLHNPAYREKYELNLKREFPRIPFYQNFRQWADWGEELMDLHLNYETIKPYKLTRSDLPQDEEKLAPKPKLKADKTKGKIIIDTVTTLENIPKTAWEYRLGNRSALEWILDQYKEKKPRDKTIVEKFNNYRFADYKETVIDLLAKVCMVSVETMRIINEFANC